MTTTLADLKCRETATVTEIDLPYDVTQRLMEMGLVPGFSVVVGCCAPSGDPRVYSIDGCDLALRRETASRILVQSITTS